MSFIANVRVTIEVVSDSIWGDDCTIGQIDKQARIEAVEIVSKLINSSPRRVRIVIDPIIESVSIRNTKEMK